jgi:hypothetical protein
LIIESIRIHGLDLYYLPRTIVSESEVFREQQVTQYTSNYGIEMYVKNVLNFKGDGKFLSRFDLEIRDEMTFTVSQRIFKQEVSNRTGPARPQEGDLLWFPFNRKLFQIKFVDHEAVFYQMGALQTYDITCELFEYSNEIFACGIEEIDSRYNVLSTDMYEYALLTTDGDLLADTDGNILVPSNYNINNIDDNSQQDVFNNIKNDIVDFSEDNPFSENKFK